MSRACWNSVQKSKTTMVSMKWSLAHVEVVWYFHIFPRVQILGETCLRIRDAPWWGEKPTKFQWLRGSFNIIKKSFNKTVLLHFLEKILTRIEIPCCFWFCLCGCFFSPKGAIAIASEGGWSYIIHLYHAPATWALLKTSVFTCRGIAARHRGAFWKRRSLLVLKAAKKHRSNIHSFLRQLLYTY